LGRSLFPVNDDSHEVQKRWAAGLGGIAPPSGVRTIGEDVTMRMFLATIFILSTQPAEATCHKYSVWRYPYPQRCVVKFIALASVHKHMPEPPNKEFVLPDLTDIDWGQAA